MKVLSIKNPWAYLIAKGFKCVENRTWQTKYRGKILIHVSKKWDVNGMVSLSDRRDLLSYHEYSEVCSEVNNATGCIIGHVDLVDIVDDSESKWAVPGEWHWVLENPVYYEHYVLDVKGRLSLWNYEPQYIELDTPCCVAYPCCNCNLPF